MPYFKSEISLCDRASSFRGKHGPGIEWWINTDVTTEALRNICHLFPERAQLQSSRFFGDKSPIKTAQEQQMTVEENLQAQIF